MRTPLYLAAIALLALVGDPAAFANDPPPKKTPDLVAKGRASYGTWCAACHGANGDGDGPAALNLNPKPRSFRREPFKLGDKPEDVWRTITSGSPGTAMIGWAHLPDEERWALAYYVLEMRPAPASPPPSKKGAGKKGKPR